MLSLISDLKNKIVLNGISNFSSLSDIVVFNTESAFYYYNCLNYRRYFDSCNYIAIDGVFLKIACIFHSLHLKRYHGPDLMHDIINSNYGRKLIVGGSVENRKLVESGLVDQFYELPFSDDISHLVDSFITNYTHNEDCYIFLFVSLGLPKQEIFCQNLRSVINDKFQNNSDQFIIIPVGAACDFINGSKHRSSKFWQKFGLEWLPRLIREPRMLIRILRSIKAFFLVLRNG